MNKEAWISGITAFIIAAGGALGVVLVGEAPPTLWQVLAAIALGLVSGAKDVRSLMKLPPVVAVLIFAGVMLGFVSGCKSVVTVKPGSDPLVVHAEWVAENSANSIDQFLAWERGNEAVLQAKDPSIHGLADLFRDDVTEIAPGKFVPTTVLKLRTLTKQYQADKSAANGDTLKAATSAVLNLANEIRAYMGLPPLELPKGTPTVRELMTNGPTNGPNQ